MKSREDEIDLLLLRIRSGLAAMEEPYRSIVTDLIEVNGGKGAPEVRTLLSGILDGQREAFEAGARSVTQALVICADDPGHRDPSILRFVQAFSDVQEESLEAARAEWEAARS